MNHVSGTIRKWLKPFGLDRRPSPEVMTSFMVEEPGHGKALELTHKITEWIDATLRELVNKDQQIEFLRELYYNLGGIMHALISERMDLEGIKELEKPPDFIRKISVPFPLSDHMICYSGGKVSFHPYKGKMEDFKKLIRELEKKGFTFSVSGDSEYFPGYTFKIVIEKKSCKTY